MKCCRHHRLRLAKLLAGDRRSLRFSECLSSAEDIALSRNILVFAFQAEPSAPQIPFGFCCSGNQRLLGLVSPATQRLRQQVPQAFYHPLAALLCMMVPMFHFHITPSSQEKCERSEYFVRWSYLLGYFPYSNEAILMPVDISVIPAALLISVVTHD